MLKETSYKAKFDVLAPWMPHIIDTVKKDLKNDHLKGDFAFCKLHFAGKNINKLTTEELATAYTNAIASSEKAEEIGEFITNRWLVKNSDLYHYFEQELTKINPNFNDLDVLDKQTSLRLMNGAVQQFGAPKTYLFCVMNSVVFPKEVFDQLSQLAEKSAHQQAEEEAIQQKHDSVESMQRNYEQQIARLTDKYEKKLQGLQKKYATDVDALKKQVANLQRKLNANG